MRKMSLVFAVVVLLLHGACVQADLVGFLSTPFPNGLISGDNGWSPGEGGYRVDWTISQNIDGTWHYRYAFSKANGDPLSKLTSHFIISLSDDLQAGDLYNFNADVDPVGITYGVFGPSGANPGFPAGESISGVKLDLINDQAIAEFDCARSPMWGDFYAKDGKTGALWNYAYNTDLGVEVANLLDYTSTPVDALDNELHKILVPDTAIPEPATICLFALGGLILRRRKTW
ncbi:MAG: PEP-CTERM sorting domain-containing protein [Planctomycetota bacterium]|jgi:hypothetical protein